MFCIFNTWALGPHLQPSAHKLRTTDTMLGYRTINRFSLFDDILTASHISLCSSALLARNLSITTSWSSTVADTFASRSTSRALSSSLVASSWTCRCRSTLSRKLRRAPSISINRASSRRKSSFFFTCKQPAWDACFFLRITHIRRRCDAGSWLKESKRLFPVATEILLLRPELQRAGKRVNCNASTETSRENCRKMRFLNTIAYHLLIKAISLITSICLGFKGPKFKTL